MIHGPFRLYVQRLISLRVMTRRDDKDPPATMEDGQKNKNTGHALMPRPPYSPRCTMSEMHSISQDVYSMSARNGAGDDKQPLGKKLQLWSIFSDAPAESCSGINGFGYSVGEDQGDNTQVSS